MMMMTMMMMMMMIIMVLIYILCTEMSYKQRRSTAKRLRQRDSLSSRMLINL